MFDGLPSTYETKPEIFSLRGLIAWLETQDPATEYDFWNCQGACLLSTYLSARGLTCTEQVRGYGKMLSVTWRDGIDVSCDDPWTYAAALDRARFLSSQSR